MSSSGMRRTSLIECPGWLRCSGTGIGSLNWWWFNSDRWGNLFINIIFVLFIWLLVHRLFVRISLPFFILYKLILYWSGSTAVTSGTTQQFVGVDLPLFNLSVFYICGLSVTRKFPTKKRRRKGSVPKPFSQDCCVNQIWQASVLSGVMTSKVRDITKKRNGNGEALGRSCVRSAVFGRTGENGGKFQTFAKRNSRTIALKCVKTAI